MLFLVSQQIYYYRIWSGKPRSAGYVFPVTDRTLRKLMTLNILGSKLLTFPTPLLQLLLSLSLKEGGLRKPSKGLSIKSKYMLDGPWERKNIISMGKFSQLNSLPSLKKWREFCWSCKQTNLGTFFALWSFQVSSNSLRSLTQSWCNILLGIHYFSVCELEIKESFHNCGTR